MPLRAGGSPSDRAVATSRWDAGNAAANSAAASLRTDRLFRVSATSRMIRWALSSRCLSAIRRSIAWTSRIRVSASIGSLHPGPEMTASHARRSPGRWSGTSARHPSWAGRVARNRASVAIWAASRTRSPFGYVRSGMSSPTTAPTRTRVPYGTLMIRPRSIRLTCECEIPTLLPSSRCVRPDWSRPSRSSSPVTASARRSRRCARSSLRSRVTIATGCQTDLHSTSPLVWCSRCAHQARRAAAQRPGGTNRPNPCRA